MSQETKRGMKFASIIAVFALMVSGFSLAYEFEQNSLILNPPPNLSAAPYTYLLNTTMVSGIKVYQAYNSNERIVIGGPNNLDGAAGSSFSQVFQAAIDSLRGICGNIKLSAQVFNMTAGVTTYPCISIVGPAGNGDFNIEPNTALIYSTDNVNPAFTVEVDPANTNFQVFPYLAGFTITGTGNGATADGVFVTDVNGNILDMNIRDIKTFNMGGNCYNFNSNAKIWVDTVYAEDCKQNGFVGKANTFIMNSYIFGNSLDGVRHISGGLLNVQHSWIFNNVQRGVNCQNINNVCMISNNIFQNNGGTSFSQTVFATSATISANPLLFSGNTLTDTRGSGFASAFISIASASSQGIFQNNYFWSSGGSVPCFSFTAGGYVANGNLANVVVSGNQAESGGVSCIAQQVTTNFLIGGTSAAHPKYIGPFGGNSTTPKASTDYIAANVDQFIGCSGGTGVNIVIKDSVGNTRETVGTCPATTMDIPRTYSINFGAFSVAPTVTDFVASF